MNFHAWSDPVDLIPSVIVGTGLDSLTLLCLPCARIQYHMMDLPDLAKHLLEL